MKIKGKALEAERSVCLTASQDDQLEATRPVLARNSFLLMNILSGVC